jgi:hypothetical protein
MGTLPLRFPEGNDVLQPITVITKNANNSEEPYDLTGYTITVIRKLSRETLDDDVGNITEAGTIINAVEGQIRAPFTSDMLSPAGAYWYKVQGVITGKTVTLAYGPLEAIDT